MATTHSPSFSISELPISKKGQSPGSVIRAIPASVVRFAPREVPFTRRPSGKMMVRLFPVAWVTWAAVKIRPSLLMITPEPEPGLSSSAEVTATTQGMTRCTMAFTFSSRARRSSSPSACADGPAASHTPTPSSKKRNDFITGRNIRNSGTL